MKNSFTFIILIINLNLAFGQSSQNPISILRSNDNFNYLKSYTLNKGINKLKHIEIWKNANISFGGELREQYQYFDNLNFGDVPPTTTKISVG